MITAALSYAEDFTNVNDVLLSENIKAIYVITVTGDAVGYRDTSASRIVTSNRITIADGYRAYVATQITPFDGYLYPALRQVPPEQVKFLSNGQLTTNLFLLGPIVFPYTFGSFSGGLDPIATFQPPIAAANNLQVCVQVVGTGLGVKSLFAVKKIVLTGKGIQEGISYKVLVESTNIQGLV